AAALWARAVCGVAPDARMLDIGCGPGRAAEGLLAWMDGAGAYTGFDVSKPAIAAAQARLSGHANARFIHADIRNGEYNPKGAIAAADYRFPAEDASVGYAFALSVFTHMRSADTAHYLREAARVLAPGGVFMATLFVLDRESRKAMALDRAAYRFDTPVDAVSETIDRRTPERAIAFDEGFVGQALAGAGLTPAAFHPGTWRGRDPAMAFQDMIVARKG
ncbi:MAG: class I SAM-dependent methyltransferase, partial [Maricaulaceae bacterium]|nr:class I SAM-dependent methyltransferase [Maricaulaceae bacterium]